MMVKLYGKKNPGGTTCQDVTTPYVDVGPPLERAQVLREMNFINCLAIMLY